MAVDIGPKIGIDGEAEFRKSLQNINQQLKTLGSEMNAVTSAFGDNADSEDALAAKTSVLNKQIEAQQKKIDELNKGLTASAEKYGENDTRTLKWQQAVNDANAELSSMKNQLGKTNDELDKSGKKSEETGIKFEKLKDITSGLGSALSVAAKGIAAVGTVAAGAATAVGAMVKTAAYNADDINTMAKQYSMSVEDIQKFQYATEQIDVPLETLTGSMQKLTKNMATASKGTGDAYEAFKALGVEITNQDGTLRDRNEVFNEAINALANIENETQRDAYAMQIFGKSAADLNPLILGGADALKTLGDQAQSAGLILEQDQLDTLNLLSDAIDTFKATLAGTGNLLSTEFAAPMADALNQITAYIQELTAAFAEGGFPALADKAGEVLTDILATFDEYLPKVVEFGTEIILKMIDGLTEMIPNIISTATEIIISLVGALIEAAPKIIEAATVAIVTLANGIAEALPELIPAAIDAVLTIVETLIDNVDQLIDAAIAIMLALTDGLIDALPMLIEKAPEIIEKFAAAAIEAAPKLLSASWEMIQKLIEGLKSNLPELLKNVKQMVIDIKNKFLEGVKSFTEIGKNIVTGIWDGIKNAKDWLWDKITGFASSVVDGFKDAFDIHSPSRLFRDEIGAQLAAGVGLGFTDEMRSVAAQMQKSIPTPEIAFNNAAAGMVNGMSTAVAGIGSTAPATIILQTADGQALARWLLPDLRAVSRANPEVAMA